MKKQTNLFLLIIAIFASSILMKNLLTNGDKLVISGNQTINGDLQIAKKTISPGNSPGIITIDGNLDITGDAVYKCELKDLTGAGSGHDQIIVTGNLDMNWSGTLEIILDGYTPNSADEFQIMKCNGTLGDPFASVSWPGTMQADGWQIDYGNLIPKTVTIYGANSEIPLKLLNFNLQKRVNSIDLSWQTASEKNTDFFDLEQTLNGKDFTSLGHIKAQGDSRDLISYNFSHKNPQDGMNYYRLKQIDLDGKFTYSKTISTYFGKEDLSFYPNPASETITFNQEINEITIYDLTGKEILHKENIETNLDISKLKPGVYIIDINNGQKKQKLMIE